MFRSRSLLPVAATPGVPVARDRLRPDNLSQQQLSPGWRAGSFPSALLSAAGVAAAIIVPCRGCAWRTVAATDSVGPVVATATVVAVAVYGACRGSRCCSRSHRAVAAVTGVLVCDRLRRDNRRIPATAAVAFSVPVTSAVGVPVAVRWRCGRRHRPLGSWSSYRWHPPSACLSQRLVSGRSPSSCLSAYQLPRPAQSQSPCDRLRRAGNAVAVVVVINRDLPSPFRSLAGRSFRPPSACRSPQTTPSRGRRGHRTGGICRRCISCAVAPKSAVSVAVTAGSAVAAGGGQRRRRGHRGGNFHGRCISCQRLAPQSQSACQPRLRRAWQSPQAALSQRSGRRGGRGHRGGDFHRRCIGCWTGTTVAVSVAVTAGDAVAAGWPTPSSWSSWR